MKNIKLTAMLCIAAALMTGCSAKETHEKTAADSAQTTVGERSTDAPESSAAGDIVDGADDMVHDAASGAGSAAGDIVDGAGDIVEDAGDAVGEAADDVGNAAKNMTN